MSSFILVFSTPDINKAILNFWANGVRNEDMFGFQTLFSRIGLWLRAIDVFNYSFPFGIGHGMYTLYINESFVPQVAESIVFEKSKAAYYGISASKNASYHNAFFQFIGDFNFLGLVTLIHTSLY